jgi:hypothetical protein
MLCKKSMTPTIKIQRELLGFNSRKLLNPKHGGDEMNECVSEGSGARGEKSKCSNSSS